MLVYLFQVSRRVCVYLTTTMTAWMTFYLPLEPVGAIHLYRNDGNMEFTDVSIQSNLSVSMEARAVIAADYDNDGDQDVFIGATDGISILFQNDGYGNFQDVTN